MLNFLTEMTDAILVANAPEVGMIAKESTSSMTTMVNASAVSSAIATANVITDTFERIAANAAPLPPEKVIQATAAFSSAVSNVMVSLTESKVEEPMPEEMEEEFPYIDGDCQKGSIDLESLKKPVIDANQAEDLYGKFETMTNSMKKIITAVIAAGQEFEVNERFFSVKITKKQLQELPGYSLDSSLAGLRFPTTDEMKGRPMFIEAPGLVGTDSITIVV